MTDFPRLIEHAFPLKQASLDSVHEKNVRHGHISTLHIWPARRPLAACRAALIATLLPDPGDPEKRRELCEKIGGRVVKRIEKKKMPNGQVVERVKEETEGGILHWGRETENAETLEWFRQEIRKAYGGRAPKVLDPFAGGGAIPLEAMRLGCEATAVDINPVAWFILKCTLEYPQKLAGQTRPLPEFILHDDAFMAEFFKKAKGYSAAQVKAALKRLHTRLKAKRKATSGDQDVFAFEGAKDELEADLAWHVRAWGQWVLARARKELAQYYPTYADFEPIKKDHIAYERQPMRLVPLKDDGTPDIDALNAEFTQEYLEDKRNPRWVAKPTVAYLWARTVTCKNCRATVPLLKTRWLCKKKDGKKRILLHTDPADDGGLRFRIEHNVPARGGNVAQRREHDKRLGSGTMSRSGVKCPCCPTIMTMEDIRLEGKAGRLSASITAVVVDGPSGKEYRSVTEVERACVEAAEQAVSRVLIDLPGGDLTDATPPESSLGNSITRYGMTKWSDVFTGRQQLMLGTFASLTRQVAAQHRDGSAHEWYEAISAYLALAVDRLADASSTIAHWAPSGEFNVNTFQRFALSMSWDFSEVNGIGELTGSYSGQINWVALALSHFLDAQKDSPPSRVVRQSATKEKPAGLDLILTDPPYYGAIPYSDTMDLFYVWLRRSAFGLVTGTEVAFADRLGPKWDRDERDGELVDDPSRHDGDSEQSRREYEDGMARAFAACRDALAENGRMVVVFANKDPVAWGTLVAALIRAGFIVDGSWPIQTERAARTRSINAAALASSVWLVCRKRPVVARPGWDNRVLEEMRENIAVQLREFWDAGIRGPDFVWAATGPALEAYSKHPVVRKANEPNATMSVGEFLNHVRRMVVDYVVGQVLTGEHGADMAAADRLDEVTAYYLLHRHDFGMDEAPVGACILYATACGLSDSELDRTWDILSGSGKESTPSSDEDDDAAEDEGEGDPDADADVGGGGGSKVKLKAWSQRKNRSMGYDAPEGKAVPLIDRIHRLMHLWKDGDLHKVDEYIDEHGLRRHELFKRVVQSLIELSSNSERSLLEKISNHIGAKGAVRDRGPELFETKASEAK
jgi:adenine-specific DNA methylase